MSQSGSQAAAFFREVARHRVVWYVRDDQGSPIHERAMPHWSSRARAQRAAGIWGGGLRTASVSLEKWREVGLPDLGLHVAVAAQRKGIGRALMRSAEDLARQRGAGHLSLDVDEAGALAFYQVLGYTVVRQHQHHWRSLDPRTGAVIDEGIVPALIMRRPLATPGRRAGPPGAAG